MTEAAYREGLEWLDQLMLYLENNKKNFTTALKALNGVKVFDLESTYLAWVDFSGTGMKREDFIERLRHVGLAPSEGRAFGPEGELCMRFNIACRHALLDEAMARLADAFTDLQ